MRLRKENTGKHRKGERKEEVKESEGEDEE